MAITYRVEQHMSDIHLTLTKREAKAFLNFLRGTAWTGTWGPRGHYLSPEGGRSADIEMATILDTIDDAFLAASKLVASSA